MSYLRVSYEKLLTNFGKLQSEKTSCQQEFERETQRLEEENQCLRLVFFFKNLKRQQ